CASKLSLSCTSARGRDAFARLPHACSCRRDPRVRGEERAAMASLGGSSQVGSSHKTVTRTFPRAPTPSPAPASGRPPPHPPQPVPSRPGPPAPPPAALHRARAGPPTTGRRTHTGPATLPKAAPPAVHPPPPTPANRTP